MEKTIAVVVTYNRRLLLAECIKALRNQTKRPDTILVVNNGSTDTTEQWLKAQTDLEFITQNNVGSGGGFTTGIEWAYKNNYSWIWCMDDDGYPKADAFENILAADTEPLSLRNCAVVSKKDKKSFVWKTGAYTTINEVKTPLIKGIGHPFNGTLLHRNIIEKVGLPKSKLFLWGDESEYYCRIVNKYKIPVYTVTNSVHYHPEAGFSFKRDWDYRNNWKMYYYVRNRFHINKSKFSTRLAAFASYCMFLFAMAAIILVFQKTHKAKKMAFLFWPATDAFVNNFNATPSYILTRLSSTADAKNKTAMPAYFRNVLSIIRLPFGSVRAAS